MSKKKGDKDTKTRRVLIDLLKSEGVLDTKTLAERLSLSPMAVRLQLAGLAKEGLVESENEARPRGRPAKLWKLSEGANRFFPDGHAELLVDMLGAMSEALGEAGVEKLLAVRAARQEEAYRNALAPATDLKARLEGLASLRTDEGYMASIRVEEDGAFLLVENHCPICTAANTCQGLCRAELSVFRAVVGGEAEVERVDHILAGAQRCAYRVVPRS